ncbi:hypothetical protein [Enterococcus gilvus]|uniref:Uncharacterized protein n=1 Tax=Enterococcus gilvus ATCC BAA-350 TaxID=1158614 RepID=R2Y1V7_9ENTE|nr:hypothetical protein [Enterococcus gilvus]EOI56277.1 hypothetical protein UKC_02175 [Enterococcus gilvus ATCC BAA-350]EOW82473.1 hypothetical protein I592_01792 [Enterococcus gilvus ATCC BAA-350]MBS5821970.1 hypothetical protein [Enterococcus gilvus]OJG44410.1 hypothetical protein RV02_GL000016 [Enterococcus gilvus]
MDTQELTRQKLFALSRKTLEKRIRSYYFQTNDGKATIEMLITLQVREELTKTDFHMVLRSLVQRIFLKTRSTAAMRRYYLYFSDYFTKQDWHLLTVKLFPVLSYSEENEGLSGQTVYAALAGAAES